MLNRDVYLNDPSRRKLANEGVANVNDDRSAPSLEVLRYELETFVCEGQYRKGLEDILYTFLQNVGQATQPGVWVSGFYGSGKSHLVKMLRELWVNTPFVDGATARGIVGLPEEIGDLLVELSNAAKRRGGLHAASGTLGAGASGSVRLALLGIVFRSVGLPEQYPKARFLMWLKEEGLLEQVRREVEDSGGQWQEELDNFYVAETLHEALVMAKPNLFASTATCVDTLNNLYPFVSDVSSEEMLKAIQQALSREGRFPLTAIVLDEVQQYIGEDSQRSTDVQEVVEACCKNFGGSLLFIGTGQTALSGTPNLKKLEGRFTLRVELSDTDVDTVVRRVVLAKKPQGVEEIAKVMDSNLGEVSRQLEETTIRHRQDDIACFAQDYPILPVRRRFWETTLRALDPTGTDSQLRNQLSMVHKVIQTNLDMPVGHVVQGDYVYFDSANRLLQARMLPRGVHERTMKWAQGTENERMLARACGLVFLINRVAAANKETGIKATVNTLADLMVEDLAEGSAGLRAKLPGILDGCEILMKVKDEYRIQTEVSQAWNDEFVSQRSRLANEAHLVEAERSDRVRSRVLAIVKKLTLTQGESKVPREVYPVFDPQLPTDSSRRIYLWVRDGWSTDENSVRVDARQAGNQSPTIFVYIPKLSADDLRRQIIEFRAALSTLERKGAASGPEEVEARAAMETSKEVADARAWELVEEALADARVYQGGGAEVPGTDPASRIREAASNGVARLYPQFLLADNPNWDKVYEKAKKGAADALKEVGHDGDPTKHPVCKTILSCIAGGKTGAEIRSLLEEPPYGWSRDAVDGGLQALLVCGALRAQDAHGKPVEPKDLERKAIGKVQFKVESTTISAEQRIQIRKLFQLLGLTARQGEELAVVPEFLQKLSVLGERAGGEAPKPVRPDMSVLEAIRLTSGNEQLLALYNRRDELGGLAKTWDAQAKLVETRWPHWERLLALLRHANELKAAQEARQQVESIKRQRLLLGEPDPVQPLVRSVEDALRHELVGEHKRYSDEFEQGVGALEADRSWAQLPEGERLAIRAQCGLDAPSDVKVATYDELLGTLGQYPLSSWRDRMDALPGRVHRAREAAAKYLVPEVRALEIPRRTLSSIEEVDTWLAEVSAVLKDAVRKGPVVLR
ncbi:MAG TPA: BREX system P-loop protein BrxC [Anaerolineales bacterium]|nr:BREX system P-loop protein BrxC [Anaerolineales bacterium]